MQIATKRFNWLPMQSAWKEMEIRRAKRAQYLKQDMANQEAMNSAFSTAFQSRISESSNLYATAALKRVQAAAKAKSDEALKQIDDAQKLLDQTTALTSSTSSSSSSTSTVLDTTA